MSLNEKDEASIAQIERRPSTAASDGEKSEDGDLLSLDVRAAAERKLVRMLDWRLLPTIVLIFIMNYIDVSATPFHPMPVLGMRDVCLTHDML